MALNGQTHAGGAERWLGAQEAWPCGWVQVSWDDLAHLCRRLAEQVQDGDLPEVVVALARAGYVPGAILASLLRCDLLTLGVPPAHDRLACGGVRESGHSLVASLQHRVSGRRVLVFDETTRTGESLAWAVGAATEAGAASVRTAVLVRTPGGPAVDRWAASADAHLLQPWIRDCARPTG